MTFRWVEQKRAVDVVRRAVVKNLRVTEREAEAAISDVRRWLERQPDGPLLVGAKVAAEILGVQPPHISRLRTQGRMPEAVPIEGTADAYVRVEVEALAKELNAERAERAKRRAERNEG